MSEDLEVAVERYMSLPYRMDVYFDDDYWVVEFPELPGLVVGHETWDGLAAAIEDAKRAYFTAALELGQTVPEPVGAQPQFSGRVMLRLPKSLHRAAVSRARQEGVSLNTLITIAVSREIGWLLSPARGVDVESRRRQGGHLSRPSELDHVDQSGLIWSGPLTPSETTWQVRSSPGRA